MYVDCAKKNKENMAVRNTELKNYFAGKEIEQDTRLEIPNYYHLVIKGLENRFSH